MNTTASFPEMEEMRKEGKFEEAARRFESRWRERRDAASGWRLVYCLRKIPERRDEAMKTAREVFAMHPGDAWVKSEFVWAIYDAMCRPAIENADLGGAISAAEAMAKAGAGPLPWKLAVFAVIDAAKKRADWKTVSDWCDRLDRAALEGETNNSTAGARKISDLERWYFAKVKALLGLKHWEEAETVAMEALARYPRRGDFSRWVARSKAERGDVTEALLVLLPLSRREKAEWYLLEDIAEYQYRSGAREEAYRMACRAALAFGEPKAKVNLFAHIGEWALSLEKKEVALRHVRLARLIRRREGWPIPEALEGLGRRLAIDFHAERADESGPALVALLKECRSDWIESAQPIVQKPHGASTDERHRGRVSQLLDGRPFAFIRPEKGDDEIYVRVSDIPLGCRMVGARVEYRLISSFDAKKAKESVRAVDLRKVESAE